MCGRFALNTDVEKIREQFQINSLEELPKSYNVAPTESALCLINTEQGLQAVQMRWGVVPWYIKGKKPPLLINARAETVAEKPAFRQNFEKRRCLMLMSGFFEWRHTKQDNKILKQPYFITRQDKQLMAVAAIWENYKPEPDVLIPSCCVLTRSANKLVSSLHDRMPWILSQTQQHEWLSPKLFELHDLTEVMNQNKELDLECYPVTPSVNSALYKEKDVIQPLKKES